MKVQYAPEIEDPPTETKPQRSGGWLGRLLRRVRLGMSGNHETLRLENQTDIFWLVYHNYHQLGIIDPREQRVYQLQKHGTINVRPTTEADQVDYLVITLAAEVNYIRIYRRQVSRGVEIYDMRAN